MSVVWGTLGFLNPHLSNAANALREGVAPKISSGTTSRERKSEGLRKALLNLSLFAASVGFGLLLAEFGARLFLNPSDFLSLEVVPDDILGATPSRSALAAFDKWGFRNPKVPQTTDIVAVGDSHTYGNTARMVDSWPYVLGRLTGRQVYNMC